MLALIAKSEIGLYLRLNFGLMRNLSYPLNLDILNPLIVFNNGLGLQLILIKELAVLGVEEIFVTCWPANVSVYISDKCFICHPRSIFRLSFIRYLISWFTSKSSTKLSR